jgi:hypothetical protein
MIDLKKEYCIYEDAFFDESLMSIEHIIPLSLGGSNLFTIKVSKKSNSNLGALVDGKFANDSLIKLHNLNYEYKGHRRKKNKVIFKKSRIKNTNEPVQIGISKNRIEVYSLRNSKILSPNELANHTVQSIIDYSQTIRIVFTAKVLLATGYYLYSDLFVKNTDHVSLRKLMNYKQGESFESIKDLPLKVSCNLSKSKNYTIGDLICETLDDATIIFKYENTCIKGIVGIAGKFIGSITFLADTLKLNNTNDFENGHIINIKKNGILKMSYKEMQDIIEDSGIKILK